jgi:hypothetical protein
MFLLVDDIHQIVVMKIVHIVFHNQDRKYLDEAKKKNEFCINKKKKEILIYLFKR